MSAQPTHIEATAALLARLTPRELCAVLGTWRERQAFCAEHAPAVDQALAELALALNVEDAARELAALPTVETLVHALLWRAWPGEAAGYAATPGTIMAAPARLADGEVGAVGAFVTPTGSGLVAIAFRHGGADAWSVEGEHAWTREIGATEGGMIDLPKCFTPPSLLMALLHRTRDTGRDQVFQPGVGHTSV